MTQTMRNKHIVNTKPTEPIPPDKSLWRWLGDGKPETSWRRYGVNQYCWVLISVPLLLQVSLNNRNIPWSTLPLAVPRDRPHIWAKEHGPEPLVSVTSTFSTSIWRDRSAWGDRAGLWPKSPRGVVGGGVEEFPTHWQHYWCNLSMQATIEMLLWVGPLQPDFH